MSPPELRDAIEAPAKAAGLRLDEGLADLILHDLGAAEGNGPGPGPGALPLLSHALWAIWQRRQGSRLTVAGYRAAGRVAGAIAKSADEAYDGLSEREKDAVQRMLPRLVRVGDEVPDTIRDLTRDSLLRGLPDQPAAASALSQLAGARLVTLDRDTVRLSHEALLRSWPRLTEWTDAARDWLKAAQRLTDDARAWRESGKDRSRLYRGGTLAAVREKAAGTGRAAELPPDAAGFLAASERQERRAGNVRKAVITVLSLLLVLAVAGGGTTLAFQRQADAERNTALARFIAAEASQLSSSDPNLATQLSLIAYQADPQSETGAVIARQGSHGTIGDGTPALDMAPVAGGRVLAVSTGTAIRLLDLRNGALLASIGGIASGPVATGSGAPILAAATAPIASLYPREPSTSSGSSSQDLPDLQVWNIASPAHPRRLATVPARTADITALALSGDGRLIATGSPDGTIHVWDATDPRRPTLAAVLPGHGKTVYSLAFGRDGRLLASAGADHETRLWTLSHPASPRLLTRIPSSVPASYATDPATPHRIAFSPDGRYLAVAAGSGSSNRGEYPQVWDVSDPRAPRKFAGPQASSNSHQCSNIMGLTFAFTRKKPILFSSCYNELDYWALLPKSRSSGHELFYQAAYADPSSYDTDGQVIADGIRHVVMDASTDGVQIWQTSASESGALGTIFARSDIFGAGTLALSSSGPPLLADTAYLPDIRLWNLSHPAAPANLGVYPELIPPAASMVENALAGAVALSGDGHLLAASEVIHGKPVVALRRTAAPKAPPVAMIRDLRDGAVSLALSPDGHLLAVADNANYEPSITRPPTVRLFTLSDPAHPRLLTSFPDTTFALLFSPDGRMLVAFTANMMLSWDVTNPARPAELPPQRLSPASGYAGGAFSPDGTMLAVKDSAGALWLWHLTRDRPTGNPAILSHEPDTGTTVAFSHDGRLLASPGMLNGNDTVDLWDVSDPGNPRFAAQWVQSDSFSGVNALGFSPAGHVLVVGTSDYINFWSTSPVRIAANLCGTIGDTITPAQWQRYVPGLPYRPPCRDGVPAGR